MATQELSVATTQAPVEHTATARWTGAFYLGLAVAGVVGNLLVRGALYVPGDPGATVANLVKQAPLAKLGIAAEISIVVFQALVAVWFYKLFRRENSVAAGAIAAFGLVNAGAILVATAFSATALAVAGDVGLAPGGDQGATVQLLSSLNEWTWALGGLFFGLWLIPMGYVVVTSKVMPALLGWTLMIGGVGYVLSTYATALMPDAPAAVGGLLTAVATIGEFWMIGYLLTVGVRRKG